MYRSLIRLYNRIILRLYGRSLDKELFSIRNGYRIWSPRAKPPSAEFIFHSGFRYEFTGDSDSLDYVSQENSWIGIDDVEEPIDNEERK